MTPNTKLIRKVMAHIRANPDKWNQRQWGFYYPGTSHCFGGWAIVLADKVEDQSYYGIDGTEIAQSLLGLDDNQAYLLFEGGFNMSVDEYEAYVTLNTGVTFP